MKQIFTLLFFCSLFSIFTGCSGSDNKNANCNKQAQILDDEAFNGLNPINNIVTSVTLNENCLDITVSSSGCDPNNWEMNLFGTDNFSDSDPVQRQLKIEFINEEFCLAVFQKTVSFDLTPLQIEGQHEIILNIEDWPEAITYHY